MRAIGVFCGSRFGAKPEYAQAARELGELAAQRRITLVYGGGKVGLMGALADASLAAGGRVIGVMPQFLLDREVGHTGLSELRVVRTLSERKILMGELSDAFIALPGGLGTLDEFSEVWTWTQLGLQRKRCGLLNIAGYFDSLIAFVDRAVSEGFLQAEQRASLSVAREPAELLAALAPANGVSRSL